MTNENEKVIESGWYWSTDGICFDSGAFATRDAAIKAARKALSNEDYFFVIFGKLVRINIKEFVGSMVENANVNSFDQLSTDEIFDDVTFDQKRDLDKLVGKACDAWQKKYKLEFSHYYFDKNKCQKIEPVTAAAEPNTDIGRDVAGLLAHRINELSTNQLKEIKEILEQ